MKKYRILILMAAALMAIPMTAQKRKALVKKKKVVPVVVEPSKEEVKFEEMLGATQQIMFIDSVVVKKQELLNFYRLTSEAGAISGYNSFFRSEDQPYSTVYVNQLGNKCWFANNGQLYTIDKLNGQWSEPLPIEGLGRFQRKNYPFMLTDGLTLYFAAISDEGLGGLDIYMSRYDSESGKFLLAENIGLPFNSSANDYMYAIDEFNGIGYFATDRRQPEGMVCIYTFIPNQKRITYTADDFDEETIRSRAKIDRISDTWGDGQKRSEALSRLTGTIQQKKKPQNKQGSFTFVVNDDLVYTRLSDFHNTDNRERMNKLSTMKKNYQELNERLEKSRAYYATKANVSERSELRAEILSYEQEYYQLEEDIRQLEKTIRYTELQTLKQ